MDFYKIFKQRNITIDKDVFDYGYTILKNYFIIFIISMFFSLIFQTLIETLFFFFSFVWLRRYLGDFHFNNSFCCNFFSLLLIILVPISIKYFLTIDWISLIIICALSLTLFLIIGPLDHPNKKITKNEKTVFKKKGFIIEIFFLIILLICKFFNFNIIVNSICMSFICSSISQVIALIKIFREQ